MENAKNMTGYRTSVWPTDHRNRIGEPVVEFVSRIDLMDHGWSRGLIRKHLPKPDGTRDLCDDRIQFYFRLDRVLRAEQTEPVRSGMAHVRRCRRGQRCSPLADRPPLALRRCHLLARGWTDGLIRQCLPEPDGTRQGAYRRPPVLLYAAARVEAVEASDEFRAAWALAQKRVQAAYKAAETRAEREAAAWEAARPAREAAEAAARAEQAAREEARRREELREKPLRAAFPKFRLSITDTFAPRRTLVRMGRRPGLSADAALVSNEFDALVRGCDEAGFWQPAVDWLLEHPEVGDAQFRAALGFLAVGNHDGWRAWTAARRNGPAATHPEADPVHATAA